MMRRANSFFIAAILTLTSIYGCQNRQELTFTRLISNAERYNQKEVTVEGFYFDSFEFMGLCEGLKVQDNGRFAPEGEAIWINGEFPRESMISSMSRRYRHTPNIMVKSLSRENLSTAADMGTWGLSNTSLHLRRLSFSRRLNREEMK